MLDEFGAKVSSADRGRIEQIIRDLNEAREGEDVDRIQRLIQQLQQASQAIGQQVYAQQQAGPQAAGRSSRPSGNGGEPEEEEVIEGEFEEV